MIKIKLTGATLGTINKGVTMIGPISTITNTGKIRLKSIINTTRTINGTNRTRLKVLTSNGTTRARITLKGNRITNGTTSRILILITMTISGAQMKMITSKTLTLTTITVINSGALMITMRTSLSKTNPNTSNKTSKRMRPKNSMARTTLKATSRSSTLNPK
jgi:hypothetical protein